MTELNRTPLHTRNQLDPMLLADNMYLAEEKQSALSKLFGSVVGAATEGSNIPEFTINLNFEPEAKRTLYITAGVLSLGAIITAAVLRSKKR